MPTSTYAHVPDFIRFLDRLRPARVLDIGLGNGKMGFLTRDFLDVMLNGEYRRDRWKTVIDGIEVFGDYIQAHQRALYDGIHVGDAFEIIDRLGIYDLVIVGDVLEHFPRDRGEAFLDKCFDHTSRSVILSIPLGPGWTQPALYGNPAEEHLSAWDAEDFQPWAADRNLFEFPMGPYGIFLLLKSDYLRRRAMRHVDALVAVHRFDAAWQAALVFLGGSDGAVEDGLFIAGTGAQCGRVAEAAVHLDAIAARHPDSEPLARARRALADLLQSQGPPARS